MKIFPAIDLYEGKAVRLLRGDYANMTVYSENPVEVALAFEAAGAKHIHLVDLEGARDGTTPNIKTVKKIAAATNLFVEIGGGIRNMEVLRTYFAAGVDRVILGTAAVNDRAFLESAVAEFGERVAVGVDIKDGFVAIKGWVEKSTRDAFEFCLELESLGVRTIICTDVSRDGAMQGANHELYSKLGGELGMQIVASGGVSDISDVERLRDMGLYGAIIGKAYYTGAIDLARAIRICENDN